jgi:hypothetical protein
MPKTYSERRNTQIPPIKVTEEQKAIIEAKAAALDMTVADYIRLVALHAEINIKIKD